MQLTNLWSGVRASQLMGQVSTEQTVAIIESVSNAMNQPDPVIQIIQPDPNYWWLALIAVLPVIAGGIHWKRKKYGKR